MAHGWMGAACSGGALLLAVLGLALGVVRGVRGPARVVEILGGSLMALSTADMTIGLGALHPIAWVGAMLALLVASLLVAARSAPCARTDAAGHAGGYLVMAVMWSAMPFGGALEADGLRSSHLVHHAMTSWSFVLLAAAAAGAGALLAIAVARLRLGERRRAPSEWSHLVMAAGMLLMAAAMATGPSAG
ncbi:hypothetical protein [Agromyces italicus]|uniref:hypothetical protein n=1 Tax=Agromyces italicus TaxID=279572 RepID=UPI00041C3453|nr:hypothetical protein [Agromyces italicus]